MIRIVATAALVLAAASPALAFERVSTPAPRSSDRLAGFSSVGQVMRLAPGGVADTSRFFSGVQPRGPMVVYELPKDVKPASHIDVNDPRDNPFMTQPERKSASQR